MTSKELRNEREKLGLSRKTMAAALGVSARSYERWENDRQVPPLMDAAIETAKRRIKEAHPKDPRAKLLMSADTNGRANVVLGESDADGELQALRETNALL